MTGKPTIDSKQGSGKSAVKRDCPSPALLQLVRLMARIEAEAAFAKSCQVTKLNKLGEGIEK